MVSPKDILIKPIKSKDANFFVKKHHYSGKVVNNSCLHLGCFLKGQLLGVIQFGSPTDKRKVIGLVKETPWYDMLELNRMAFSDLLPRNSESRCIAIAMKLIKKNYPHIKWVLSFSDATRCGDGTIYRASGFDLIGIKKNTSQLITQCGKIFSKVTISAHSTGLEAKKIRKKLNIVGNNVSLKAYIVAGAKPLKGFQLKYIYFLDKKFKDKLTVPILPFSEINKIGAGMYKGKKRQKQAMDDIQSSQRQGSTDLDAPKN